MGIQGLSLGIPYGLRRILSANVKTQMRGDLKLIREFRSGRIQHIWEMEWACLSPTDRTNVDSHFSTYRGRMTTFGFTDPWDGLTYTCRYDTDVLQLNESAPTRWGTTIRIIEVANWKALKTATMAFPVLSTGAVVQLPYSMGRGYRTEIGAAEDFTEKRYEDYGIVAGIQRWPVGGDVITDAEAGTLLDFWEACHGSHRSFSFTEPQTNVGYATCHFVENQITHTILEYNANSVRATVEELK